MIASRCRRLFAFDDVERRLRLLGERLPASALTEARRAACQEIARRALPGIAIIPAALIACGLLGGHHEAYPRAFTIVLACALCSAALRLLAVRRFRAAGPLPDDSAHTRFFIAVLLLPALWGSYSAILLVETHASWQGMVLLSFTAAIASSVVLSYGMWLGLAMSMLLLVLAPTLLAAFVIGGNLGTSLVFGCATFSVYLILQNLNWNRIFWTAELNTALLELRSHELERAKEEAERASRAKTEFLTRMSHELRTPMNAVLGFAQLIELQTPPDSSLHEHGSEIRVAGRHLMALIEEILDLSRIEAGRLTLQREALDLAALTRATVNSLAVALDGGAVHLRLDLPRQAAIVGDALRVRQVLLNVIGNAVKFTEQGTIDIGLRREEGHYCLSIADTGPGIPNDLVEQIFAPFVQVDARLTRRGEGTGLGLPIAKHLLEMMGGRIAVSSEPGCGSEFRLYFPGADPAAAGEHTPTAEAGG